jgi:esterase
MILHAVELGQGPPVALLHGLFGRAQNLASVARGLAASFRVISLDLRNHGSSAHAAGMAYAAMADDVMATLAGLGALPVALVGHSMGGKTAMAAALAAPEQVRRLIVADIAPVAYAHHNAGVAAALQGLVLRAGLTRADAARALENAVPDASVRGFLLQNLMFGEAPHWRIGLDEIAAGIADIEGFPAVKAGTVYAGPALFLRGARSDYVSPAQHAAILTLFPAARIRSLADAGHWLHADQPAAFLAAVAGELTG